ncbi:MAG: FtsW/RodA/SpoVE family cell cycle protein [Bacteroides sp.]|nr:FtsW/RodA/SpoVE family cell cycle protein [Bacteroides sp.]
MMNKKRWLDVAIGYAICVAVVLLGMFSLRSNLSLVLNEVEENLRTGRTIVLDTSVDKDTISRMLIESGYMADKRDASLAARWITEKIKAYDGLENLGQLNTPSFKIPADTAWARGGKLFASRIEADNQKLGMNEDWNARGESLSTTFGDATNTGRIIVKVSNKDKDSDMSIAGIPVRLTEHSYDSVSTNGERTKSTRYEPVTKVLGFAVTDSKSVATFNVEPGHSYSVLPISSGRQYGQEKGTTGAGKLDSELTLSFKQSRHVLSPFSASLYQTLKSDGAFVVRTPAQFYESCNFALVIYICGWAMFLLFLVWRDYRMGTQTDYLLAIIVMALSGIGILASYAINNPLTDKPNGYIMAQALMYGLIAMAIVSSVNLVKYYNGKSRVQMGVIPFDVVDAAKKRFAKPEKSLERKTVFSLSSGFMYLGLALIMIAMLAMFGTGPEGSDARVNLGPFQPSEISKYLIIVFIAAFFAENAHLLQSFSERLTKVTFMRQLSTVSIVAGVMLVLMLIYLKVLSDMGPALVLLVTFIMIYSMARRDFAQLLLGIFTFVLAILVVQWIGLSPLIGVTVWFVAWIAGGWLISHRLYESALIMNLLVVVFLYGDKILRAVGAESEAIRLANRTEIAGSGVWDNTVIGGDQVAQGLWSLATGGLTGMGLGQGSPSLVPACHTDMVFTSIGELLGLTGLLLVIICFVVLVHRSLLIGKKAAHPFVMYLVMGVAIVTGVQFLFIVLGSLGLMPLTGISVPFLSYGRTSFIITMAMFGLVLSASRVKSTESQRKYANTYNVAIAAGSALFIVGGLVIIATLIKYQVVDREEMMIRPAYITNTMGERVIEYNPRINIILNKLQSGNIYDRNGLLLATNSRDDLLEAMPALIKAGLTKEQVMAEYNKRRRRYYPFGDQTLFMLGDANSKSVYSYSPQDPVGYLAESRHFGALRELDIRDSVCNLSSDKFRANRFLPPVSQNFRRVKHDYRVMVDFLNHGIDNNPLIEEHNANRPGRDLYLTFDARLQMKLQKALDDFIRGDSRMKGCENVRASVVVLDASNGDFLCSANYPLPSQDSIVMLNEMRNFGSNPAEKIPGHAPLTERDLGMTFPTPPGSTAKVMSAMSGFMKDPDAGSWIFEILPYERVEGAAEPAGMVGMADAIRLSSNNYFMNLVNKQHTYPELERLYALVGVRVEPIHRMGGVTPYFFSDTENVDVDSLHSLMNEIERDSYNVFDKTYMGQRDGKVKRKDPRWNINETAYAWGQGGLRATPLSMARVASIVANGGKLMPTRYVMRIGDNNQAAYEPVEVMDINSANILKSFMQGESDKHRANGRRLPGSPDDPNRMGGKTGTPERYDVRGPMSKSNDAWYICFVNSKTTGHRLAVALRIERTTDYTRRANYQSGVAVDAIANSIIPALNSAGYKIE